jgi:hypothetical protein
MYEDIINIVDGQNTLKIKAIKRQYPESPNNWDRDALDLTIIVTAGVFHAEYDSFTYSHEIQHLYKSLCMMKESFEIGNTLTFELREKTVKLVFQVESNEQIIIEITVTHDAASSVRLSYDISLRRAEFEDLIKDVEKVLEKYPVQLQS